jgi:hypothetical protein
VEEGNQNRPTVASEHKQALVKLIEKWVAEEKLQAAHFALELTDTPSTGGRLLVACRQKGMSWSTEPDWNLENGEKNGYSEILTREQQLTRQQKGEVHEETEVRHRIHRKKSQSRPAHTACKREFLGPLSLQPKNETVSRSPNQEIKIKN